MRKFKILIVFVLLSSLIWYLFIKPSDYIVKFKAKTSPGALLKGVEEWSLSNQKNGSFSYKVLNKLPFTNISQEIKVDGLDLELDWGFKSINDSITQVVTGVSENRNSFYNRITTPFFNTSFKQTVIKIIKNYKEEIEYQLKEKIKLSNVGIDTIPEISYAYIDFKNVDMLSKAQSMIDYNDEFIIFLNKHNIKDGDLPFLIIDNWNLDKNNIDFRYCFPAKLNDTLPKHKSIKFGQLKSRKALKVIYNGNYKTSDRGWFALHEYSKRHHIEIENKPIEIFYNNPFDGGNDFDWKTEIYVPIK